MVDEADPRGLRYLDHRESRLLLLPHHRGLRPAWLLWLGLFLHDHLESRKCLTGTPTLDLRSDKSGGPLKAGFSGALDYSDCWVMGSRLVALNARDAADRGAEIRVRTAATSLRRDGET